MRNDPTPVAGPLRLVFLALGGLFVALGALGAFLPVLPTTPFLILAAACFARSSSRLYRWLLDSPLFGPLIRNWRDTRTIPARAKAAAITLMVLVGGSTVAFSDVDAWLRILVAVTLLTLIVWMVRLPSTVPAEARVDSRGDGPSASS